MTGPGDELSRITTEQIELDLHRRAETTTSLFAMPWESRRWRRAFGRLIGGVADHLDVLDEVGLDRIGVLQL